MKPKSLTDFALALLEERGSLTRAELQAAMQSLDREYAPSSASPTLSFLRMCGYAERSKGRYYFKAKPKPSPGGRPLKAHDQRRTEVIRVYISDEERTAFQQAAKKKGVDLSTYMRLCAVEVSQRTHG